MNFILNPEDKQLTQFLTVNGEDTSSGSAQPVSAQASKSTAISTLSENLASEANPNGQLTWKSKTEMSGSVLKEGMTEGVLTIDLDADSLDTTTILGKRSPGAPSVTTPIPSPSP